LLLLPEDDGDCDDGEDNEEDGIIAA